MNLRLPTLPNDMEKKVGQLSVSNQIALEAKRRILALCDIDPESVAAQKVGEQIKSAIEKATEQWKQRYELALSDSQHRGELLDKTQGSP